MEGNFHTDIQENPTLDIQSSIETYRRSLIKKYVTVCGLCIILFLYMFLWRVPSSFPTNSVITIQAGESLKSITKDFTNLNIIRSPFLFQNLVILFGGEKKVIAGDYLLETSQNPAMLAWRIIHGSFGMEPVKVTIPEGFMVTDIANILEKNLIQFDTDAFIQQAQEKEGYLFPDTYFFPPTARPEDIVSRMNAVYIKKTAELKNQYTQKGKTEHDIVTMASILEGEAQSSIDRAIVSGILWNRIKNGMPLQVDATFKYINGKGTAELTLTDLATSSPYNTYVHRGLPPGPINNPGIDAITAALYPTETNYVYFLTGKDGTMHYAKTFEEHKKNNMRYLR
jgi:UPF0755 protein